MVENGERVKSEQRQRISSSIVRPIPLRCPAKPVAVQVVRPIPKRVSDQFYDEAFQEGLNLMDTTQAATMANEWHRKWTHQDERNHINIDTDFYSSNTLPQDFPIVDRQGARNPSLIFSDESSSSSQPLGFGGTKRGLFYGSPRAASPSLDDFLVFNPEDRLSTSLWSDTSSLSSHMAPQMKRRFHGAISPGEGTRDDDEQGGHVPISIRPLAFRPSAVRPVASRPMLGDTQTGLPQSIVAVRRYGNVSPMTNSEASYPAGTAENTSLEPHIVNVVEDDDEPSHMVSSCRAPLSAAVAPLRDEVLHSLAVTQGDVDSPKFKKALDPLLRYFSQTELDAQPHVQSHNVDGMWLTLSKPTFFGCLGENDNGDPMYTLGRMSFDMFSPTNIVCSLQGNFNPVEIVTDDERNKMLELVPKSLREEVESGRTILRTYHVVTAFTIEPSSAAFPKAPNKDVHRPIRGIMTTYGYCLPDPEVNNRHSIWFTGGRIEPNNNPSDIAEWKRLFALHPPKHSFGEKAKLLAVKLLMGAVVPESINKDGSMEYTFTRPIGGHGIAYVDLVYMDESMRIVRGHRGTVFVFSRVPKSQGKIQ